jgi:hypothetical protein
MWYAKPVSVASRAPWAKWASWTSENPPFTAASSTSLRFFIV